MARSSRTGMSCRASSSTRVVIAAGDGALRAWIRNAFREFHVEASQVPADNDWRRMGWIVAAPPGEIQNGNAEIGDFRESTNEMSFRVRSGTPVFLVASLVQDGGWRARDDRGRPVETTLANGPFLGLRVGPGERRILLRYLPPGFRTGAVISGSTLGALLLYGLFRRLRARSAALPC